MESWCTVIISDAPSLQNVRELVSYIHLEIIFELRYIYIRQFFILHIVISYDSFISMKEL